MKLSRPVDQDTKQKRFPPMEAAWYKWQISDPTEWAMKKPFNELSKAEKKAVDVISIRWLLTCVEDPRYDGSSGRKAVTRNYWTPYWASDEKIETGRQDRIQNWLKENPTASQDEAEEAVQPWKPQTQLYEFLYACGVMERIEDDEEEFEYRPIGWDIDNPEEGILAAIGSVVYGKIGESEYEGRTFRDSLLSVGPVREEQ